MDIAEKLKEPTKLAKRSPGGSGWKGTIYRAVFKRSSTFALSIAVGCFIFEKAVDDGCDAFFDWWNKGKLWKDIEAQSFRPKTVEMSSPSAVSTSGFTCLNCRVKFINGDLQRDHYKSHWHRYNLKRKVVGFEPVTAEQFEERVREQNALAVLQERTSKESSYCQTCRKSFNTEKALENHLHSKKHLDSVSSSDGTPVVTTSERKPSASEANDDIEIEEVDSDEWEGDPIPSTDCLFCSFHSASLEKNLDHMTTKHSFFIPEIEYIVDLDGLITYLGEKVGCGMRCLWCNERGRRFYSTLAAQRHMRDKGHCKIPHDSGEDLLEFADFYDFSPSYPEGFGTEDADEELPPMMMESYEASSTKVDEDDGGDGFLKLPSGSTIGHRALFRYFKQNPRPERAQGKGTRKIHSEIIGQYKALGYSGSQLEVVQKKARDLHFMRKSLAKSYVTLGVKANKLQKHFRVQHATN
ncbi:unnamed protein product [Cyprideis torosa]|uniref:Cytochrome b-c1 complex subunit 9 n=1 Tax=Cyprideis torosa TaxID=163714 RepID=A0A7R8ZHG4_9CRUS|nr:unnamed protein product [Cyprideis torosa]CAG0883635.1 unnamed protein product [Cyprideis torosa]